MQNLNELIIRVFSEKYPDFSFQSLSVFAHSIDNYKYVIDKACEIYLKKNVPIVINGARKISGYVGVNEYKRLLQKNGVKKTDIIIAKPIDENMLHTRNESIAYIQTINQLQFLNNLIVSVPFHQIRAFMTMVTIVKELKVNIKLYNCPVINFDWNKTVTHSQDILRKVARELIYDELERIKKYQMKGDLASTEDVLNYLNTRDL